MDKIFVPDGQVIDNNEWDTDYDDEYYDDHRATASSNSGDFLCNWDICYGNDGEYINLMRISFVSFDRSGK